MKLRAIEIALVKHLTGQVGQAEPHGNTQTTMIILNF
jgi:hypothetical protein